ncbi:centromere protein c-like [Plakobranchus ocellatus]|uniref:Centromere protein c-like n=1 Tax=Plakobranchus ocellatus TaxID=259542 RepID=A0AAV3YV83_9GAST|nr:centromere protein c-like [Plakobranchus ocellatus]
MQESVHIYNPLNRGKGVGRRTGKVVQKKRNIHNAVDNFDDYLSTDDEKTVNITDASMVDSKKYLGNVSTSSFSRKETSSVLQCPPPTEYAAVIQPKNKRLSLEASQTSKMAQLFTRNSRFGRRTGKDLLAGKNHEDLSNFSNYLSECNETGSLNPSPVQPSSSRSMSSGSRSSTAMLSSPRLTRVKSDRGKNNVVAEIIDTSKSNEVEEDDLEEDPLKELSSKPSANLKHVGSQKSFMASKTKTRRRTAPPITDDSSGKESDDEDGLLSLGRKKRVLRNSTSAARVIREAQSKNLSDDVVIQEHVSSEQGAQICQQNIEKSNQQRAHMHHTISVGDEKSIKDSEAEQLDMDNILSQNEDGESDDSCVIVFKKTPSSEDAENLSRSQMEENRISPDKHAAEAMENLNRSRRQKKQKGSLSAIPNEGEERGLDHERNVSSNREVICNNSTRELVNKKSRANGNSDNHDCAKIDSNESNIVSGKELLSQGSKRLSKIERSIAEIDPEEMTNVAETSYSERESVHKKSVGKNFNKKYKFDEDSDSASESKENDDNKVCMAEDKSISKLNKEKNLSLSKLGRSVNATRDRFSKKLSITNDKEKSLQQENYMGKEFEQNQEVDPTDAELRCDSKSTEKNTETVRTIDEPSSAIEFISISSKQVVFSSGDKSSTASLLNKSLQKIKRDKLQSAYGKDSRSFLQSHKDNLEKKTTISKSHSVPESGKPQVQEPTSSDFESASKDQNMCVEDKHARHSVFKSLPRKNSSIYVDASGMEDLSVSRKRTEGHSISLKRNESLSKKVMSHSSAGENFKPDGVFMSISSKQPIPNVKLKETLKDKSCGKKQRKLKSIESDSADDQTSAGVLREVPVKNNNKICSTTLVRSIAQDDSPKESSSRHQKAHLTSKSNSFRKRKSPVLESGDEICNENQSQTLNKKTKVVTTEVEVHKTEAVDIVNSIASKTSYMSVDLKDTPKTGNRQKFKNSRRKIFSDPLLEIAENQENEQLLKESSIINKDKFGKDMEAKPQLRPRKNPRLIIKKSKSQKVKAQRKNGKVPQKIVGNKKMIKSNQPAGEEMEPLKSDTENELASNESPLNTSSPRNHLDNMTDGEVDNSSPVPVAADVPELGQDIQEYDANESSEKQIEVAVTYTEPLKSSPGKKRGRIQKIGRRKNSMKALSLEGNVENNGMSSPISLRLIDSLPSVTPQSGVSFRRFRNQSSMHEKSADSPDPYSFTLQRHQQPETNNTPCGRMSKGTNGLTSCLRDSSVVRPFQKGRRVRISNFIDMAGDETKRKRLLAFELPSATLLSPSSSPVHYAETTHNQGMSDHQVSLKLPDLSHFIVRPDQQKEPTGLRRSQRTRVKPVAAYKGERVIYRRDSTGYGLVVDAIQPSVGEAKIKANEEKRRKTRLKKRLKAMTVPTKPNKRLSTHVHDLPQEISESDTLPAVNPDTDEEVLIEMISRRSDVEWKGPDLDSVLDTDPLAGCVQLQQPSFSSGEVQLRALAEKAYEKTMQTLIYTVLHGKIFLTINEKSTIVETGDDFFIPRGSAYGVKNLRRDVARLHFVALQDSL